MPRKGFRVTKINLVTTLLDATLYPVEALAQLYYARWGIETNFAHLKTTMGLEVLKCKTVNADLCLTLLIALVRMRSTPQVTDGRGGVSLQALRDGMAFWRHSR